MDNKVVISIARIIDESNANVSARVAAALDISRQSASTKLSALKKAGVIASSGTGRGTRYTLVEVAHTKTFEREGLDEDHVWRELCLPVIQDLPENVRGIWHHGITEMVNNAIDHSGSKKVKITIQRNALRTMCCIADQGEGIFKKIQRALNLYDTREAILELAKGKLTTDPERHSGEGIFFSSKMFDRFLISSDDLDFVHLDSNSADVLLHTTDAARKTAGTSVRLVLANDSTRTAKEIFDKFAAPDEFSFAKTIVPVKLAQYEGESLISRSQAKRLTRRFERFQTVIVDFEGVATIGQAFADEVFRVFAAAHPKLNMIPTNMSQEVRAMIQRVKAPDGLPTKPMVAN